MIIYHKLGSISYNGRPLAAYGDWVKDDIEFWSDSIADCYAWIKAKQEGLIGL